jgi:undecaprenyl-diphosphatase
MMTGSNRARSSHYSSRLKSDPIWIIASIFVVGGLILGLGLLGKSAFEGANSNFDQALLMVFRSGADPANPIGPAWLQGVGRDLTSLGSFAFLGFISAAAAGYFLITRRPGYALHLAAAVTGGGLIITVIKADFDRPTPVMPHVVRAFTESFPSGHAILSAITFLTLGALLARASPEPRVKAYLVSLAVLLTLMAGISRVYLGVHYPTDVLAGWCVGSAWAILCWSGSRWLEQRGERKPTSLDAFRTRRPS